MNDYITFLQEAFAEFGAITARKMFGCYGIYHQGLMFALVANDTLYLKADADNVCHFEALQLPPFQFNKNGKLVKMSYYQAPDEIMDDAELAATWARRSFDAALQAKR